MQALLRGLIAVATLLRRSIVLPDLPCNLDWIETTPGGSKEVGVGCSGSGRSLVWAPDEGLPGCTTRYYHHLVFLIHGRLWALTTHPDT